jgi:hypothetical protein
MPGSFLRGALVSFSPTFGVPLPNVVVFQFNPETISHSWSEGETRMDKKGGNPLSLVGYPEESFSFTLAMNADSDAPSNPLVDSIATVSGIYSRIAALEMLMNPSGNDGLKALVGAVSSVLSGGTPKPNAKVPVMQVPIVLFVWGIGRIVPVRVTSLTITEKLYDVALNPTYAEAQISLAVLTPQDLADLKDTLSTVALASYDYTLALRQALALANLANSATSIIGMIP